MEVPYTHEVLRSVNPRLFLAYLVSEGWTRTGIARRGGSIWQWTDPDTMESYRLFAPEDATFEDYTTRLSDAIQVMADAKEKASPSTVLADLIATRSDVIRFISQAEVQRDGSVPVQDGMKFLRGIQDTLKASAKAQIERRSYYGNLYWDRAKSFLQSARLGQTEVGSYVVTIFSRVPGRDIEIDETSGQLTVPGAPRAERYIVETLMRSLDAARHALDDFTGTGDVTVFQDAVSAGVSADLCSGLAVLAEGSGGTGVKVNVQWSPLLAVADETPTEVGFGSEDVEPLQVGAESLKSVEVETDAMVSGWVETLHREEDQPGPGVITLVADEGTVPRGGKVRIALDAEDYATALNAHSVSSHVTAVGDLVQKSGRNWLHNARLIVRAQGSDDEPTMF